MHVVHVQGGATARGIPAGSQAASLSSGVLTSVGTSVGGMGVGGVAASPGGPGLAGGASMNAGAGLGGPGKVGLGMIPSGPGSATSGVGAGGGIGGSGVAQAASEAFNPAVWCLIDDGALGVPSASATSATSSATTAPIGSTGAESAAVPKKRAVLVEAEKDIEALITKLKNLWLHRQHAQVEVRTLPFARLQRNRMGYLAGILMCFAHRL